jgi:signal transduction histidine kinase
MSKPFPAFGRRPDREVNGSGSGAGGPIPPRPAQHRKDKDFMEPDRQTAVSGGPSLPEVVVRTLRHEVGDLLQTVYATAAILQERLPADWTLERRIVADLRARGETCKNLLDTVHDLVCPLTLNAEPVNLAEVAAALVGTATGRYPHLRLHAEGPAAANVIGDAKRLAQMGNLLLSHACQRAQKEVWFRTEATPGEVRWIVADDGPEMPAEQLERLFTPFTTTRHAFPTLAVALAQKIAALHGGQARAGNRPGGGFQVEVTVSAAARPKKG